MTRYRTTMSNELLSRDALLTEFEALGVCIVRHLGRLEHGTLVELEDDGAPADLTGEHVTPTFLRRDGVVSIVRYREVWPPAFKKPVQSELAAMVVVPVQCVEAFGDWTQGMWKHRDDLLRYQRLIEETQPTCVIETGTHNGRSAVWFAGQPGVRRVITVDVRNKTQLLYTEKPSTLTTYAGPRTATPGITEIYHVRGSSTDPGVVASVRDLAHGHRVMVSLDSDHSAAHVAAEIEAYGKMVTPGCGLVVEDGVIPWLTAAKVAEHRVDGYTGDVLDAIGGTLCAGYLPFDRDVRVEGLTWTTMAPFGWWRAR